MFDIRQEAETQLDLVRHDFLVGPGAFRGPVALTRFAAALTIGLNFRTGATISLEGREGPWASERT
jgi:hypothetical protein